jgi:hypothetical protein
LRDNTVSHTILSGKCGKVCDTVLSGLLALMALAGCSADSGSEPEGALFRDVAAELGLPVSDGSWPPGSFHVPEAMQGGVGLFDYDGDGRLDILHVRVPPPGDPVEEISNRLYRQGDGGRFQDVTEAAGLDAPGFGQGLAIGDIDDDGDADVYITNYGPDRLYLNDGDGKFADVTERAGIRGNRYSTAASFFDHDADGDLDLFVVHYMHYDRTKRCTDPSSRREYCGPRSFAGWADMLYRNEGDGTFTDVTEEAGIVLPQRGAKAHGLGIICTDLTRDGLPDVFVANDAQSNQLWVNQGDGTFLEEGILRGVAVNGFGNPEASMGVSVGDVDGDGTLDLFMTHLWEENNRLYLGTQGPLFSDASVRAGIVGNDLQRTGFGCGLFDFDNDGDLDLAVANGAIRRRPPMQRGRDAPSGHWANYVETNQLFENQGDGTFVEVTDAAGTFGSHLDVSRGLAFGDLDGDGDLDMVMSSIDNSLRVYRNEAAPAENHWLFVRATSAGRDALGAQVVLRTADREQRGVVLAASSYLSSSDPRVHFGLGARAAVDEIEVLWPDGSRERFDCKGVDREVTVRRGEGQSL